MAPDGRAVSIWVPEGDDTVDQFDRDLANKLGADYSRSEKIKDAMELYRAVEMILEDLDYGEMDETSKRHLVRQALLEMDRRERERED